MRLRFWSKHINILLSILLTMFYVMAFNIDVYAESAEESVGNKEVEELTEENTIEESDNAVSIPIYCMDVTKVVVPTTLKVIFNPKGLPVTIGGNKISNATVVSRNYGIANLGSRQKNIIVSFEVEDKSGLVTFTDNALDAIYVGDTTIIDGEEIHGRATSGQYRIYLEATAAKEYVTSTSDGSVIGIDVTGEMLSDIEMIPSTVESGSSAIFKNEGELDFSLEGSEYSLKDGTKLKLGMATGIGAVNDVSESFELKKLGEKSVSGFTFRGAINSAANWTRTGTDIKITPIYRLEDIKWNEEPVAGTAGIFTRTENTKEELQNETETEESQTETETFLP